MDFEDSNDKDKTTEKQGPSSPEEGRPAGAEEEEREKEAKKTEPSEFSEEAREKDLRRHDKAGPEDGKSLKNRLKKKELELKHLKKENEDLKKENADLKDKYLRAAAEMDNQRKRLEREKNDFYQFALSSLLKEMLSVLDNFERALENKDRTEAKIFQEGLALIYRQFLDIVRKRGVTAVDTDNKKFDPAVHQAILTEESEKAEEPEVGEVLQKGYLLNDRLLRPALVKVVVPKKS